MTEMSPPAALLARRTRLAQTVLTGIGTLLTLPAAAVFLLAILYGNRSIRLEPAYLTAMAGATSGGLAWCALCLLGFKRHSPAWQLACWSLCAAFGWTTIPCTLYWLSGSAPSYGVIPAIVIGVLLTAIACAGLGTRYALLALAVLKRTLRQVATT